MLLNNYNGQIIPEWAGFFSNEQYERFMNYVSSYFSGQDARYSFQEGAILQATDHRYGSGKMGLMNLAQLCRLRPDSDWESVIHQHFDGLRDASGFERDFSSRAHDFEVVREHIGVRIYPDEYVSGIKDGLMIGRAMANGIYAMLVFDFPHSVVNVRPEQTVQWNMSNEELFQLGLINMKKKYPLKMTRQLLDGVNFHLIVEDHYYAPNILFDLEEVGCIKSADGILVGVPNRHAVLIHPVRDLKVLQAINRMVPAIYGMYRDGPGSLSDKLYWLNNGTYTPLPYTIDAEKIQIDPPGKFLRMLESLDDGRPIAQRGII